MFRVLKNCYSTVTRLYVHMLPNPIGYEVSKLWVANKENENDRRIKHTIVSCPDTYHMMAKLIVPDNIKKPVDVYVIYRSIHVLGCDKERLCKMYRIQRDDIKEMSPNNGAK